MFYDFYRKDGKLFFYKWDTQSFSTYILLQPFTFNTHKQGCTIVQQGKFSPA